MELSKYEASSNLLGAVEPWVAAPPRVAGEIVAELVARPIKRVRVAKRVLKYSRKVGWGLFYLAGVIIGSTTFIFFHQEHLVHSGVAHDLGGVPVTFFSGGYLFAAALGALGVHVVAYFFKSKQYQVLVDEKFFSLGNPKFVAALVRHGDEFGISAKLRDELCVARSGLGLTGNGYDVINWLAANWDLSFEELLNTANSLGR